ncbi:MAG: MFS transporter [Anaerolineaceae bacterium]|nr:MFS transporter [Anaerolineaceae bacterium]
MFQRFRSLQQEYPLQFWLMFWGMLISTTGSSMIWPFLMIYVSEKLSLPLVQIASLMTINAVMGLIFSFLSGPIADRVGRKGVMVISLAVNGVGYLFYSHASTFFVFAVVMALNGAFSPLYRVGADSMMADMIPADKRVDAYSLIRMSNNLGVALGPAIGGIIAILSYTTAFYIAAACMVTYSLLLLFYARETLQKQTQSHLIPERWGGYGHILRDKKFISFVASFALTQICSAMIWVLLSVYTKKNFNMPENLYGLLPTTNAVMVVTLQLLITKYSKRYPPLWMLALGSLFYAVGVGSVALGQGFWGFWVSMVILTIGELILVPTSTTYTANLAPAEMRGRYMSMYTLTWGIGTAIGPILGGYLNDNISPASIWYGGLLIGLIGTGLFIHLASQTKLPERKAALSEDSLIH